MMVMRVKNRKVGLVVKNSETYAGKKRTPERK